MTISSSRPARRWKKLPPRAATIVMPLLLSGLMSFIVSGIATWRSVGFTPAFPTTWMSAWGLSWLVAFPTVLVVLPLVRRLTALVVETPVR